MTPTRPTFDPEAVIDAMAPLLGLVVAPDYRPGVAANLTVTAGFAALVVAFEVDDEAEAAPVFAA